MSEGKLVAAQRWGVLALAESGVLKGKRYAFPYDPQGTRHETLLADATYSLELNEDFILQDRNIITSPL